MGKIVGENKVGMSASIRSRREAGVCACVARGRGELKGADGQLREHVSGQSADCGRERGREQRGTVRGRGGGEIHPVREAEEEIEAACARGPLQRGQQNCPHGEENTPTSITTATDTVV